MINPPVPRFPAQSSSWRNVARLCRRICLLHECGRSDEAEQLRRTTLADALKEIGDHGEDSGAAIEQRVDAIFAVETERVENAAMIAELLAPLLERQTQPLHAFGTNAAAMEPPAAAATVKRPRPEPLTAAPATAHRNPADLSHFIDEMLTQERPESDGSAMRRAS